MKKRFKGLTLLFILLVTSLVACSKESDNKENTKATEDNNKTENVNSTKAADDKEVLMEVVVTINPEVKLYINAREEIVKVDFINEDAKNTYTTEDIVGRTYDSALTTLVEKAVDKGFIDDKGQVDVEVVAQYKENTPNQFVYEKAEQAIKEVAKEKKLEIAITVEKVDITEWVNNHQDEIVTYVQDITMKPVVDKPTEDPKNYQCEECNGTGKCRVCNGSILMTCEQCKGSKLQSCPRCGGTKVISCPVCEGKGFEICSQCGGDGFDGEFKCFACGGTGKPKCNECNGTGNTVCESRYCGGTGTVECENCNGTGSEPCKECDQSGKCTVCNGSGMKDNGDN